MHLREATRYTRFPLPSRKKADTSQDDSEQRLNYPMDLPVSPLTTGGTQGDWTPNLRTSPHCLNLAVWIHLCMSLQINIQIDCNMPLPFTAPFVLLSVYLSLIMEQLWFPHIEFFKVKIWHTNMYSSWLKTALDFSTEANFLSPWASHLWGATLACFGFNRSCQTLAALSAVLLGQAGTLSVLSATPGLDLKLIENSRSLSTGLIGLGNLFS